MVIFNIIKYIYTENIGLNQIHDHIKAEYDLITV